MQQVIPDELPIPTIADLGRVLDDHPEIRGSLRRKLLTDEERRLPVIVEQLNQSQGEMRRYIG